MRPDLARYYRVAMTKVGDLLHQALRTADRQGNPLEVMVGICGVVQVPAVLMMNSRVLTCHLTGSAGEIEAVMRFAQADGAGPMVEHMPLSRAAEGLAGIHAGEPPFRIGLHPAGDQ